MGVVFRSALTLIFVALTAFCCFGFLESFEPGAMLALFFRWLYGAVAVACVFAITAVWRVKTARR